MPQNVHVLFLVYAGVLGASVGSSDGPIRNVNPSPLSTRNASSFVDASR